MPRGVAYSPEIRSFRLQIIPLVYSVFTPRSSAQSRKLWDSGNGKLLGYHLSHQAC